jgi:hypothetical protein
MCQRALEACCDFVLLSSVKPLYSAECRRKSALSPAKGFLGNEIVRSLNRPWAAGAHEEARGL